MSTNTKRLHAIVSGRVQGVSFRHYTNRTAREYDLTGWVRNCADGTVEVTVEGPADQIEKLLAFLKRGPSAARVDSVEFEWQSAMDEFEDFRIRYNID